MSRERCDAIVVGSGAGGGIVAAELGARGRSVVLLEAGGHHTAHDFVRFEGQANRRLWAPPRFADTGDGPPIVMVSGRCVGGSTAINTKVALRATGDDLAAWERATGAQIELDEHYERVEARLGVRERSDWPHSVRAVERGFRALGDELEPVRSYTDASCTRCGSCYTGCPTNAGKSTLTSYIEPALARAEIELRPRTTATRVRIDAAGGGGARPRALGVDFVDAAGEGGSLDAGVVVVAGGALSTPPLLMRSGIAELGTPSAAHIGRHLGTHTARIVHGLFDEPQDCHLVYPITARCEAHSAAQDGGFVIEATTIMEPIGFASNLVDEHGLPLWGKPLERAMGRYRHWGGLFAMANDSNTGTVTLGEDGGELYAKPIGAADRARLDAAKSYCEEVLREAGARETVSTGLITSHVQGSCRMGPDPGRAAVDSNAESHDVSGLFVGDASLLPSTLSVNPSLTIMALATRLAGHIDRDGAGYLS